MYVNFGILRSQIKTKLIHKKFKYSFKTVIQDKSIRKI